MLPELTGLGAANLSLFALMKAENPILFIRLERHVAIATTQKTIHPEKRKKGKMKLPH